ncbi:transposase DDE domain protein [Orientia tsutsugamushi str. Kato PP]|uniref:Transposase n=2 Tax=Orientia tsutsugamushi TaxID=784 RepID=B3CV41_ORITI|nr:transposase DDE domain protein [Orientia tsutsugamushi str. Kato PP]BAG41238.1 transposase [Orientia tsutsugamushi str. Ikeda]SPR05194.1 transposase [Orientia tsutsugamushi]
MKTYLLDIQDNRLLNKRSLIESVFFNVLKKHIHLEHTRHRSPLNFFVHIIASLASYSISKLNPHLISSFPDSLSSIDVYNSSNIDNNFYNPCMKIHKNISLLLITQLRTTSHLCSFDYYLVLISFSHTLDISCKNCLLNSILL